MSLWRRLVPFARPRRIDSEAVEEILLGADFAVDLALELVEELERTSLGGEEEARAALRARLHAELTRVPSPDRLRPDGDLGVVLLAGVNGAGKTTTAAKLAASLEGGVLLAAADTYRAGAQAQLKAWAERVGADFVGGSPAADPAAVAFDAMAAARARGSAWVVVDTAGRLHTQDGLMRQLSKIDRVIARQLAGAACERLLVVDATSGQNVIQQARRFGTALDLTGLILAKFDSSARAGTVVSVARELGVPVRYLGVGETPRDLERFSPERYLDKLLA